MARELADKDGEGRDEEVEHDEPEIPLILPLGEIEEHIAKIADLLIEVPPQIPKPPSPVAYHDGMVGPEEVLHHPRLEFCPVVRGDMPQVPFHGRPEVEKVVEGVGRDLIGDDGGKGLLR